MTVSVLVGLLFVAACLAVVAAGRRDTEAERWRRKTEARLRALEERAERRVRMRLEERDR